MSETKLWKYFLGNGNSAPLEKMPEAPAWRNFMGDDDFKSEESESLERWSQIQELAKKDIRGKERGESFRLEETDQSIDVINAVNAALHLRRPLLITGKPGSGKTSLAYAIAHELKLGVVLTWAINARSQMKDSLYQYDAIARLQDAQLKQERPIGDYIRLGAVGTAFLPSHLPRVLLIDEIDKCDINLPNDLLNLFEEGCYEIPELVRCKNERETRIVRVRTADFRKDDDVKNNSAEFVNIKSGQVVCREFPIVVMTSNGERDFPPAFLRRCIRVQMPDPQNVDALTKIVEAHLKKGSDLGRWQKLEKEVEKLIQDFVSKDEAQKKDIATDQLLNVVYLLTRQSKPQYEDEKKQLQRLLLKGLSEED